MQTKTIKRIITNKLNQWLATITDERLRKALEEDIIVTGGCIVSLFQREEVNDFDIYIKRMDTLRDLALYYTQGYGIDVLDGRNKENLIKTMEDSYNKDEETIYNATMIAIRNLHPEQVKLFFKSAPFYRVEEVPEENSYKPIFFSSNAITLSDNIQIVCRFSGTPAEIHSNFDFVHATNYFTLKEGLVTNTKALESILTKQLSYGGSKYPLTSILRMKKFIQRGWGINAGEVLKILFQISELDLKDANVLEEQLMGVDVAYFSTIVEILRGKDVKTLTSSYINSIIDTVFIGSENES